MNLFEISAGKSAKYVEAKPCDLREAIVVSMRVYEKDVPYTTITDPVTNTTRNRRAQPGEAVSFNKSTLVFTLKDSETKTIYDVFTREDKVANMPPSGTVAGCIVYDTLELATKGKADDYAPILDKDGKMVVNHAISFGMQNYEFRKYYTN